MLKMAGHTRLEPICKMRMRQKRQYKKGEIICIINND